MDNWVNLQTGLEGSMPESNFPHQYPLCFLSVCISWRTWAPQRNLHTESFNQIVMSKPKVAEPRWKVECPLSQSGLSPQLLWNHLEGALKMSGIISVFSLSNPISCILANHQGPWLWPAWQHGYGCNLQMLAYLVQQGLLAECPDQTSHIHMACEMLKMTGGLNLWSQATRNLRCRS